MSGTGELYEYNAQGYQKGFRSAFPGTTGMLYYEAQAMDAYGHVTDEYRTSQAHILTERRYDPKTGRLLSIRTGDGLSQDLAYEYDKVGNMMYRHDRTGSMNYDRGRDLYEVFNYDKLQRLTGSTVTTGLPSPPSPPSLTVGYDNEGNIKNKYVAGATAQTYTYGTLAQGCSAVTGAVTPGPHAVSVVGTANRYCYDRNGNVLTASDGDRQFEYTPYDLPATLIARGKNTKVGFEYGPGRERIRRLDYDNATAPSALEARHFVGSAEASGTPANCC